MRIVELIAALGLAMLAAPAQADPVFASTEVYDSARHRAIPVHIVLPRNTAHGARPPIIISHGNGQTYDNYSFIARALVEQGHPVITIQHRIAGDPEMPSTGPIREVRMPFWLSGEADIIETITAMRVSGIFPADARVILIGHSMGGDQAVQTMIDRPDLIDTVITLDHRRVPVPRAQEAGASPHFCSLRSSDQVADEGVLPSATQAARLNMQITPMPIIHNDMWDGATDAQKAMMLGAIFACLRR
ncbi:MAG: alpha/beta fold hydrolase [Sphingopyxis sp.]